MTTPALQGLAELTRDTRLREGLQAQAEAGARVTEARGRYDDAVAIWKCAARD